MPNGRRLTEESKVKLLSSFVEKLENESDAVGQAVEVVEALESTHLRDTSALQQLIHMEYDRVEKIRYREGTILYALVAATVNGKAVVDRDWFADKTAKYGAQVETTLETKELFVNGVHVQRHFFRDGGDGDGNQSFVHFRATFAGQPGWRVHESPDGYLKIVSTHGAKIEIYANDPSSPKGDEAIDALKLHPQGIIYRGHSTYVQEALKRITKETVFVFLGSCGGYTNMETIEAAANPHVGVVSTQGTGTMWVNGPLLLTIAETVRDEQKVDWASLWAKAGERIEDKKDFAKYIAPHKNVALRFIRGYNKAMKAAGLRASASGIAAQGLQAGLWVLGPILLAERVTVPFMRRNLLSFGLTRIRSVHTRRGEKPCGLK